MGGSFFDLCSILKVLPHIRYYERYGYYYL